MTAALALVLVAFLIVALSSIDSAFSFTDQKNCIITGVKVMYCNDFYVLHVSSVDSAYDLDFEGQVAYT